MTVYRCQACDELCFTHYDAATHGYVMGDEHVTFIGPVPGSGLSDDDRTIARSYMAMTKATWAQRRAWPHTEHQALDALVRTGATTTGRRPSQLLQSELDDLHTLARAVLAGS